MKHLLLLLCPFFLLACSATKSSLPTVSHLEAARYAGKWHEIARLPNFFERGVVAATATYGALPDGSISVLNTGMKSNGEISSITGKATPVNPAGNTQTIPDKARFTASKLKVRFDKFPASLFTGDYWILDLNESHTHAIVGTPSRKMLWLLSKDPAAQVSDFTKGMHTMSKEGFPMSTLITNPKRLLP